MKEAPHEPSLEDLKLRERAAKQLFEDTYDRRVEDGVTTDPKDEMFREQVAMMGMVEDAEVDAHPEEVGKNIVSRLQVALETRVAELREDVAAHPGAEEYSRLLKEGSQLLEQMHGATTLVEKLLAAQDYWDAHGGKRADVDRIIKNLVSEEGGNVAAAA